MSRPHPALEFARARLREYVREPGAMLWAFGFPVLLTLVLSLAFRDRGVRPVLVGLTGSAPPEVVELLANSSALTLIELEAEEVGDAMLAGRVDVLLSYREVDGVDSHWPSLAGSFASADTARARYLVEVLLHRARDEAEWRPPVVVQSQWHGHRGARDYVDWLFPGVLAMSLFASSLWGVGWAFVRYRERGLMKQWAATPVRARHLFLGVLGSRLSFLWVELALLVGFGAFFVGLSPHFSLPHLVLAALAIAVSACALSLPLAAFSDSLDAATGWANLALVSQWVFAGLLFPYERFPEPMALACSLLPAAAASDWMRFAFLREGDLAMPSVVLLSWFAFGLCFARDSLRWR